MAPQAPRGPDRVLVGLGYAAFAVFFLVMTVATAVAGGIWWGCRVAYAWWSGRLSPADLRRFP